MEKIDDDPPFEREESLKERFRLTLKGILTRLFGGERTTVQSEEELRQLIDDGERQGVIEEEEHEMFRSILKFGDTIAREVMVPRIDMLCIREDASLDHVMNFVSEDGHSRIPVYRESLDNIVGILYVKDLIRFLYTDKEIFKVSDIMRPPFFIPETKKISALLREFQHKKVHLAIVVDEYGGTAGLVTIEDLLEELVGEIEDEYDTASENMLVVDEHDKQAISVDGRLEIDELEEYFQIPLKEDNYETVGGLIFTLLERIPYQGEQITFKGLQFTVEKVDERRVHRVKITRLDNSSASLENLSHSREDEDN
jgi:CBS domain containing-hemolysin-like protein